MFWERVNISSIPSLYIFLFFKKKKKKEKDFPYLNIPRPPPLKNPRILPFKPQTPRPQPILLTPRITRVNPLIRIHTPHQPHAPRECTQRSNPIGKHTLIERQRSIRGSSKTLPTTVELEIFVACRDEGVGREGVDGGEQVGLVGGTGYVVVGVVAEERGVAEGFVEGGGEEGEEEEGSGWFCEGEHVLLFLIAESPSVQLPRLILVIFSTSSPLLLFSSLSLKRNQVASEITLSHPLR